MREQEEQVDRIEELLKEVVKVVKEQSPMSSGVDLDYRIGDVDVNLMMRPVTGTMMSWRERTRSER